MKVNKIIGKSQAQFEEIVKKIDVLANDGLLIKNMYAAVIALESQFHYNFIFDTLKSQINECPIKRCLINS